MCLNSDIQTGGFLQKKIFWHFAIKLYLCTTEKFSSDWLQKIQKIQITYY